jgi:broad specificity polyphosphatase/5'/3'-nucleotidase SurE
VANFRDSYIRRESPRAGVYYWMTNECRMAPPEAGSDLDWLNKGHVTYTFMGNPSEHVAAFASFVKDLGADAD